MQGYNCILVYSEDRREILFCKRLNDPYEGMYNLVGGKIEPGEDGFHAAYRELFEETGSCARRSIRFTGSLLRKIFLIWKSTREKEISGIWWYRRNALDRGSRSNLENMFYKSRKKW